MSNHNAPYHPSVYSTLFDATSIFGKMKLFAHLPLLFIRDLAFLKIPVEELRQYLHQVAGPTQRIFVFVHWTKTDTREQGVISHSIMEKLRQVWAYDCVLLGREELQEIIFSPNPQAAFRKLVLGQVNLVNIAPFVTDGAPPAEMFFGRERELREITEHAATASYAVIGGRRIGKTSILKQLERVRLPAAGFRARYHDCSFTPTEDEMIQTVATERNWFPEPLAIPFTSFSGIIQALPGDKPLVILLDEADKLIISDQATGYPLFNSMRAMANTGHCRFILSGERALRTELMNPDSPLFNFANEMLIGRLNFHTVEELVTRPMKQLGIELIDEDGVVQCIWDFTSGHPSIVQLLCRRLVIYLNQRRSLSLTLDDVDAVIADPNFLRRGFLKIYWWQATVLERLCSLVMASDKGARTLTTMHETLTNLNLEVTLNQVDDALERLVDLRNILQRTAAGYEFAVTAFPEVVSKTARLDDLIALNRETFQLHGDVVPWSKRGAR